MAGEIPITVIGNLTFDPELKFSPGGDAVANMTVASTPRLYKDGGWVDGEPIFVRVAVWRRLGEHVAESFHKGSRVIVVGKLKPNNWTTKDGEKRTTFVLEAEEVGASVLFAPLGGGQEVTSASVNRAGAQKAEDTWGGTTVNNDDPPF